MKAESPRLAGGEPQGQEGSWLRPFLSFPMQRLLPRLPRPLRRGGARAEVFSFSAKRKINVHGGPGGR